MIAMRALLLALVAATGVVLAEWLFFATKPSFMSLYPFWEKIAVLGSAALIVSLGIVLLTAPFSIVAAILARIGLPRSGAAILAVVPPVLLLTFGMLVMIDNFTQTLLGWGIRNAAGAAVHVYQGLMFLLLAVAVWIAHAWMKGKTLRRSVSTLGLASAVIVAAGLPGLVVAIPDFMAGEEPGAEAAPPGTPNILIMSGDGIAARHMSVYGYARATTPFLQRMSEESLVAENHFSTAADTGAAVISLLTAKLPTTTRVIYPPDSLRGHHSFQHLPGILKAFGYYNADVSMRHYADPYDLNLRNGYIEANFRNLRESGGLVGSSIRNIPSLNPASQLIDRISERITDRYDHIWKDKPMPDPLAGIDEPDRRWIRDEQRMEEIRRVIESGRRPFFLTVHMLGTHGSRFRPRQRIWSSEEDYPVNWHIGGYDDAILDFDRYVEALYQLLREQGILETTILVITSDHGFRHDPLERLPLLIRFPDREHAGTFTENTQRIDIAPTLLDALSLDIPHWMEGRSLLEPWPEGQQRPLFATNSHLDKATDGNFWSLASFEPPWYSLGRINMVYCDQGFSLRLRDGEFASRPIEGSSQSCPNKLPENDARAMMLEHLRSRGYSWE